MQVKSTGEDNGVPAVLSTEACAAMLGLSPRTLEDWRMKMVGPPYRKTGRSKRCKVLYFRHEVLAWLESHKRGGSFEDHA